MVTDGKKREDDDLENKKGEKVDHINGMLNFDSSLPNPSLDLNGITKLDLSNNNLELIPESLTTRLVNIVMLDVHSNLLRVLPNSIGCLSKLKVLNVSGNLIESLPRAIEDCRALVEIDANFNKLIKLLDTMGFELTNLEKLSIHSNKISSLPYSTSHMTSLKILDARLNCLRSLPQGLANLVHLEILNIGQNFHHLESLPYSIGQLISLVELDISYNKITHLPNSMGDLTKLRKFKAEGNPLVFPPMDVVEQSVDAVRDYLSARMNGAETEIASSKMKKKKSWFRKIVKCGASNGGTIPSRGIMDENNGFLLSDYRSLDGLASPRYVGMFSPLRIFSPKRTPLRK